MLVTEGDTVAHDQLVAVIAPDELKADTAYFAQNEKGLSSQIRESEAALRLQERQTADQIRQAEATLASIEAQVQSAIADLDQARPPAGKTRFLRHQRLQEQLCRAAPHEIEHDVVSGGLHQTLSLRVVAIDGRERIESRP